MPGISIHVVDVAHGRVMLGLQASLWRVRGTDAVEIARGRVGPTGGVAAQDLDRAFEPGIYEVRFDAGEYYKSYGGADEGFLAEVLFRFAVTDPELHIHLPFKLTPFGFSCFRGA
jgi:5-hydroxyisourate hydrolase